MDDCSSESEDKEIPACLRQAKDETEARELLGKISDFDLDSDQGKLQLM